MTPDTRRTLITLTVTLLAALDLLNVTIVTIALPAMLSSLNVTIDQITWVLTAFAIANAIFIPLTGFLVKRFGQRKVLFISITGFMLSALFCGLANNLTAIIVARFVQGAFGSVFMPLSQLVIRQQYSPAQLPRAMAIFGMGVTIAPIAGPSLGGFITEYLSWHWVFFINIPACLLALGLCWFFIPHNPLKPIRIDWLGLILMAIGIGALQYLLDKNSYIPWLAVGAGIFLTVFIWRGIKIHQANIINLHLFSERVFCLSTLLLLLFMLSLVGVASLQPLQLQTLMGYTPSQTGLLMMARAVGSFIGMFIIMQMHHRTQTRYFILFGCLITAIGTVFMARFQIDSHFYTIVSVLCMQGIGAGFFIPSIMSLAFINLSKDEEPDAASLYSFSRLLGISLSIALMSNLVSHFTEVHWFRFKTFFNPFDFGLNNWQFHLDWHSANTDTLMQAHQKIAEQAGMLAYQQAYLLMAIITFALIPLILMLPKSVKDQTR